MAIQILTTIFALGLIILAIAIYLIFRYYKKQPSAYRWLGIALSFSMFCDIGSVILMVLHLSSNIGGTTYNTGFVILYSIFFLRLLRGGKVLKFFLVIVNLAYFIFVSYNALFVQKMNINSYSTTVGSIVILILCVVYYFKLLRELPAQQVYHIPMFWVVSALFFAKSGKLVMYSVIHYLTDHYNDNLVRLWMGHNSLTIVENSLIAYGVWLQYKSLQHASTDNLQKLSV